MGFFISAMFYVYIIYSITLDRYYIGYTSDITKRLDEHNSGISTFTAKASDWTLKYTETLPNRDSARKREIEIKKKKSRKYIEWLIQQS